MTKIEQPLVPSKPARNTTNWADGLRGVASIGVVASHTVLSFARVLVLPCDGNDGHTLLFQRPVFRLVSQGAAWVAIFFVLSGFVNALKPVHQARAGEVDQAFNTISTSTFRRTGRLMLPAAAVTTATWFICQLNGFSLASQSDSYWLRTTSAQPSPSWGVAVESLVRAIFSTWINAENPYDQPQWALFYLFEGSIFVSITLLATTRMTSRNRLFSEVFLYFWSWWRGDFLVGFNIFAGMIMAEVSMTQLPNTKNRFLTYLPYPAALLGLYLCSYPSEFSDWAPWCRQLLYLGKAITPADKDLGRFWPGLGSHILCFAVLLSPTLRKLLSHDVLLWLGSISYPLYLLHGPLMRSVLAIITFFPIWLHFDPRDETGNPDLEKLMPLPRSLSFLFILPLFWIFLLAVVHQWAKRVEPLFATATKKLEDFAYGEGATAVTVLPIQTPRE